MFELYENERAYRKHLMPPHTKHSLLVHLTLLTGRRNYPGATVSGRQTHHTE